MRVFYQVCADGTSPERVFLGPGTPAWGFRSAGRGASLPASPLLFVVGHHVPRAKGVFGGPDVVPHSPHTLIPSSLGTTSPELNESSTVRAWCLTPASPYSFAAGHHVLRAKQGFSGPDVVPHRPQTLIPSSPNTTPTSTPALPQKNSDAVSSSAVGASLSSYFLTAFIYFSSTQWNCPHSHPQFDSHH